MSLGLLGAIAGGYQAIRRGIDEDQARVDAEGEREYRRQQRANAEQDRQFQLGQRQRVLDEQARGDRIRAAETALPTTRNTTVVQDQLQEDAAGNTFQAPTQVTQQAAVPKWMQIRQRADIYRKEGDLNTAEQLEEVSRKAQFAESAQRFQRLQAGSASMSLPELAQAMRDIYNSDPLPAQVTGIENTKNGGVRVKIRNAETGKDEILDAPNKEALLLKAEAYYSPDTYSKWLEQQKLSRQKVEEEIAKNPVVSVPKGYVDRRSGRFNRTDFGNGVQIGEDANGNPIYGSGRGAGTGKAVDPLKPINDALKFAVENSGFKDQATPVQTAAAQRLAHQFYKESIDPKSPDKGPQLPPAIAVEAALDAALNPDKVKLRFDPKTGEMTMAYPFQGGYMVAERLGSAKAPRGVKPEQMRQVAADALSEQPEDMRPLYLAAAAGGKQGADLFRAEIVRRLAEPDGQQLLRSVYGDNPTEAQVKEAVEASMRDAAPTLELLSKHLDPKLLQRERDRGKPQPERGQVGGLFGRSTPTPVPPNSPAGLFQARQAALRDSAAAADAARAARQAELSAQFRADAKTMDPLSLAQKYDRLRTSLPTQDAAELQRIERQIR